MSRRVTIPIAGALLLAVAGWLVLRPAAPAGGGGAGDLPGLMRELGIVPVRGTARPFTLPSLDGRTVTLADFKGRPALVYFWATWCPYCTRELPSTIEQLQREITRAARPDGLVIVTISIQEPRETVRRWVDAHAVSFPVLLDPDGGVTGDYGVTATPTVFLIARDGSLRGKAVGTKPWVSPRGRALLEALARS